MKVRDLQGNKVAKGDLIAFIANRASSPELVIGEVISIQEGKSKSTAYGIGKDTVIVTVEVVSQSGSKTRHERRLEAPLRRFVRLG